MSALKRIRRLYETACDDNFIIESVLGIIQDIRTNLVTFPDDSPMGQYTVGDVRAVKGFWASPVMVEELVSALTGRALRGCLIKLNIVGRISPDDMVELIKWTDPQTKRCVPIILKRAIEIHGQPPVIDHDKIADLSSRAARFLEAGGDPTKL